MNPYDILFTARYEFKIISRSWLFKLFAVFSVTAICLFQVAGQHGNSQLGQQFGFTFLASEIPHLNALFFNLYQAFISLFVVLEMHRRERMLDSLETLRVKPISNVAGETGKLLGMIGILLAVNVVSISVTMIFHLLFMLASFSFAPYFFYFFAWVLPSLVFVTGLSYFIVRFIRYVAVSLFVLLSFLYFAISDLPTVAHGMFDPFADQITSQFSDWYGYPFAGLYLLQRFTYFFWGFTFIGLGISLSRRLPNRSGCSRRMIVAAFTFFFLGGGCFLSYGQYFRQNDRQRELYMQAYERHDDRHYPDIREHLIIFEQKDDRLFLQSTIGLQNALIDTLREIVLYLNPGLDISRLVAGKEVIPFHRDHQAVIIRRTLCPGDSIRLVMYYEGKIDERVCYLDVPDIEFYRSMQTHRFAYVRPDFTLLTPECLWYPVCVPPASRRDYEVAIDFSDYRLAVLHPGKKTVLSQGKARRENDRVFCTNDSPLPGISLAIGDYRKRSVRYHDIDIEVYLFEKHENMFDGWPKVSVEDIQFAIDKQLEYSGRDFGVYPYSRFVLVETPVHFHSWHRPWKKGSEFVQPEIVFLPERGNSVVPETRRGGERDLWFAYDILGSLSNERHSKSNVLLEVVKSFFKMQSAGPHVLKAPLGAYDIIPSWRMNNHYIHSSGMPVMDYVIKLLCTPAVSNSFSSAHGGFSSDVLASRYLLSRSLEEAVADDTLPFFLKHAILVMKAKQLQDYISAQSSLEGCERFLEHFFNKYRLREISLSVFTGELKDSLQVDLTVFLSRWYHEKGLSSYRVRDAKYRVLPDNGQGEHQILVSFAIHNSSNQDGVICLKDSKVFPSVVRSYRIEAKAYREIRFKVNHKLEEFVIDMGIAGNNPSTVQIVLNEVASDDVQYLPEGIFPGDSSVFSLPAGSIIVDNEDPGFRLISPPRRKYFADGYSDDTTVYSRFNDQWTMATMSMTAPRIYNRWRCLYNSKFFGDILMTSFCKETGKGEYKAEWKTVLPRAGRYNVYYFEPPVSRSTYQREGFFSATLSEIREWKTYFTVYTGDSTTEVIAENNLRFGWVLIGTFDLPRGETKVVMDDRGIPHAKIYADAVKWELQ